MKRPINIAPILFVCLFLMGCSTLHRDVDPGIALEQCGFEPNVAHYHEVLDELGPPARLTAMPGGFAFIYEALTVSELQVGISGKSGLWQLLKMSFANTNLKRASYLLKFNSDGVLVASGTLQSKEDLGAGGALQTLFSVQQIVDTSTYEDDHIDAVNWGGSLLDPFACVLNYPQNLNTGATGLEQSGTSSKVGQHTLEMR
ncbi:MAG: hypothetical protein U9P12_02625 [Verrucomicrobiota bacterium]|nr:hypothetical protein [Verrucomicrobiota bacterium]